MNACFMVLPGGIGKATTKPWIRYSAFPGNATKKLLRLFSSLRCF
jgi:hypothetical protein